MTTAKDIAEEGLRLCEDATSAPWALSGPYEQGAFVNAGYLVTTGYDVHPPEPEIGRPDGRELLHGPSWGFKEADARLIVHAANHFPALARAHIEQEARMRALVEAISIASICLAQISESERTGGVLQGCPRKGRKCRLCLQWPHNPYCKIAVAERHLTEALAAAEKEGE